VFSVSPSNQFKTLDALERPLARACTLREKRITDSPGFTAAFHVVVSSATRVRSLEFARRK
jgi:hypothetical protein